ncbi:MAG: cytochrome c oxidase assembly factor 1 family protein [Deltaproteobacteria bacterium]|nr:cytochrome c oxidase assembly factor 1 family protein [Deltaproteobacteria bacterium]
MNPPNFEAPIDPLAPAPSGTSGRSVKPWIFLGCGCMTLLLLAVGCIVGFIFYKIKDSEAGRLTVRSVQESPAAREALGEIQDTGWPMGSISVEGGGSGKATMSVSVKGSKAKGKYFATLQSVNGQWAVTSGRLQIDNGPSIDLGGGSAGPGPARDSPSLPPSDTAASGGRQLRADRAAATVWRHVEWPGQTISFDVPANWMQLNLNKREVEFRPEDRKAYFIGNLTYFDQKIPFTSLMQSMADKASAELKREEIFGYALRNFGRAQGIAQISARSDGQTTATWTGYFDTEEFGTVSVTFLLGAPTPEDFNKAEGALGAILDSVQFK